MTLTSKPIIGCTTYHKPFPGESTLSMYALTTSYVRAVEAAGGIPLMIPLGLSEADMEALFVRLDGVLMPGGGDIDPQAYRGTVHETVRDIDPQRDRTEFWMVRQAVARRKPLLAICRGHQVLNVALGGTLYEDVAAMKADAIRHDFYHTRPRNYLAHTVTLTPGSLLAQQIGQVEIEVNSLHHQGVRGMAPGLSATAVAPDGLVEGMEVREHPFAVSVQWHPENLVHDDEAMLNLFRGFVAAAGRVGAGNGRH